MYFVTLSIALLASFINKLDSSRELLFSDTFYFFRLKLRMVWFPVLRPKDAKLANLEVT